MFETKPREKKREALKWQEKLKKRGKEKKEAQEMERKAQEEVKRKLLNAEEKAERGFFEKQRELELAKVELQAWHENGEKNLDYFFFIFFFPNNTTTEGLNRKIPF